MKKEDIGALVEAAAAHCEQQEQWAHADFWYNMNAGQRKELGAEGTKPWRGVMSPSILHLIHVLEDNGHYSAPFEMDEGAVGEMLG